MKYPNKPWHLLIAVIAVIIATVMALSNPESESTRLSDHGEQSPTSLPGSSDIFYTDDEKNTIAVFQKVSPSVVFVTNTGLRRSFLSLNVMEVPQGSGTGFVWDDSGIIVTNFHVVVGANKITIKLQDGSAYDAEVVGIAPDKDIAVLRIDAPSSKLTPVTLGESSSLVVGRKVLAIGNPFALDTTLTVGVVSALGREIKSISNRTIKDVIQTDAAINPGNSGGPLLDSQGRLIGVNTAIYSPSGASAGIGFAIPVNTLKKIVPQLIEYGRVNRPILGIDPLSDSWAKRLRAKGVALLSVIPGQPAAKAGMIGVREDRRGRIHLGDVIIAVDDTPILNQDDLLDILESHQAGDVIKVTTIREDEIHNYEVKLANPE
ncbi:MAG: trypsin-like peptidase domain-containing protein [Gammaproteobacteria bacterium]|nr:trypsin-like peptidase domain-containing protein [Gammaproteobacteria bacterium]